jgi:hypothetical protein
MRSASKEAFVAQRGRFRCRAEKRGTSAQFLWCRSENLARDNFGRTCLSQDERDVDRVDLGRLS